MPFGSFQSFQKIPCRFDTGFQMLSLSRLMLTTASSCWKARLSSPSSGMALTQGPHPKIRGFLLVRKTPVQTFDVLPDLFLPIGDIPSKERDFGKGIASDLFRLQQFQLLLSQSIYGFLPGSLILGRPPVRLGQPANDTLPEPLVLDGTVDPGILEILPLSLDADDGTGLQIDFRAAVKFHPATGGPEEIDRIVVTSLRQGVQLKGELPVLQRILHNLGTDDTVILEQEGDNRLFGIIAGGFSLDQRAVLRRLPGTAGKQKAGQKDKESFSHSGIFLIR